MPAYRLFEPSGPGLIERADNPNPDTYDQRR